jgi:hypothetical protein
MLVAQFSRFGKPEDVIELVEQPSRLECAERQIVLLRAVPQGRPKVNTRFVETTLTYCRPFA